MHFLGQSKQEEISLFNSVLSSRIFFLCLWCGCFTINFLQDITNSIKTTAIAGAKMPHGIEKNAYRILVVEDDATTRYLIEKYCQNEPFHLSFADDGLAARQILEKNAFDIVVTDVHLPGLRGDRLLDFLHEKQPQVPVIVITSFGSTDDAVHFLQRGAFDYLAKPFTDKVFVHRLSVVARHLDLAYGIRRLRQLQPEQAALRKIKGTDPKITEILSRLPSIAKTDASAVFYGESGTGKELFSRALHELSLRQDMPFVSISCAALPETLIESELFGHERGAFTDAHAKRKGLVEEAEGGTLFLDEVGELSITVQAKLLRLLQEREYKPVGSNATHHANIRVVSATHRNLENEVAMGQFREDLFYRLNVVPITIPPLRNRVGDVPLLADHFLKRFAKESNRPQLKFAQEVIEIMLKHTWPGNIRELMNRVQRMVVMAEADTILLNVWYRSEFEQQGLPPAARFASSFAEEKRRVIAEFESQYISECLEQSKGNVSQAARLAKMDRKNFWTLMKRCNINAKLFQPKPEPS